MRSGQLCTNEFTAEKPCCDSFMGAQNVFGDTKTRDPKRLHRMADADARRQAVHKRDVWDAWVIQSLIQQCAVVVELIMDFAVKCVPANSA